MANVLKMAKIQSIQQLHASGWSQRRIARELGIDRGTVARYLQPSPPDPKPAIPPTGSEGSKAATFSTFPAYAAPCADGNSGTDFVPPSNAAIPPTGLPKRNFAATAEDYVLNREIFNLSGQLFLGCAGDCAPGGCAMKLLSSQIASFAWVAALAMAGCTSGLPNAIGAA